MELTVYLIMLITLSLFVFYFGKAFYRGAPFAPTDKKAIEIMTRLAKIQPGDRACDIGSGDGRIVVALANAGAHVDGIEQNPFLVWWSELITRKSNHLDRISLIKKNLWKHDYREYDVVTLFGITYIMKDLEKKLLTELKSGARVLSNRFAFPHWKPTAKEKGVYLYIKD